MTGEVKLRFYPIDVDFSFVNSKPAIRIFALAADGKKLILLDSSFKPYFYAILKGDLPAEQAAAHINYLEFEYRGRKVKFSAEKASEATPLPDRQGIGARSQ